MEKEGAMEDTEERKEDRPLNEERKPLEEKNAQFCKLLAVLNINEERTSHSSQNKFHASTSMPRFPPNIKKERGLSRKSSTSRTHPYETASSHTKCMYIKIIYIYIAERRLLLNEPGNIFGEAQKERNASMKNRTVRSEGRGINYRKPVTFGGEPVGEAIEGKYEEKKEGWSANKTNNIYEPTSLPFTRRERESESALPKDRLFLLQMPKTNPLKREGEGEDPTHYLPSGKIGKLRVHKSGRLSMKIGEYIYDVERGTHSMFSQELAGVDKESNQIHFLDTNIPKFVATPNYSYLLNNKYIY